MVPGVGNKAEAERRDRNGCKIDGDSPSGFHCPKYPGFLDIPLTPERQDQCISIFIGEKEGK